MIYLHMGFPRTGTTSIQIGLEHNKEILEEGGYFYPDQGIDHYGHHNIFYDLIRYDSLMKPTFDGIYDESKGGLLALLEQIRAIKSENPDANIILSSEAFIDLNTKLLRRLVLHLNKLDEIQVITCLRRQERYLLSFWSLEVGRMHIPEPFNEWAINVATTNSMILDYLSYYFKLNSVLPKSCIKFVSFGDLVSGDGPLHNFLSYCSVPAELIDKCETPLHANPSPGLLALELLRQLSVPPYSSIPEEDKTNLINGIIEFSEMNDWKRHTPNKKDVISEECFTFIRNKYNLSNQLIYKEFPHLEDELNFRTNNSNYMPLTLSAIPKKSLTELNEKLPKFIDIESFL